MCGLWDYSCWSRKWMESLAKCVVPTKNTRSMGQAPLYRISVDMNSLQMVKLPQILGKLLSLDLHPPTMLSGPWCITSAMVLGSSSFPGMFCFTGMCLPMRHPLYPQQHGKYRNLPSLKCGFFWQRELIV